MLAVLALLIAAAPPSAVLDGLNKTVRLHDVVISRDGARVAWVEQAPTPDGPVTLTVPKVILLESFLSFLGLGVQEPMTSWGVLIQDGVGVMETAPWILLFPAALLSVTLYCINFVGDGLRDALDPKDR